MSGKEVQKWADDYMFEAEEIDNSKGPEVFLLSCNPDPLGSIAAAAKAYKGEFVASLADVTDDERRYYLREVQKTALAMPLEAVQFHFRIRGVTRGFTHQMVRQRTAAYSQESTRFAVKSRVPVGLPPSLADSEPELWAIKAEISAKFPFWDHKPSLYAFYGMDRDQQREVLRQMSAAQAEWEHRSERVSAPNRWRSQWDKGVERIEFLYNSLVNEGMPAEDARGILPTNLLTQINYITNLRNLQVEAGKRLCTQAQFEWRIVLSRMVEAIRTYGADQAYFTTLSAEDAREWNEVENGLSYHAGQQIQNSSSWQFDALAKLFKPVCYLEGSCPFNAEFDRKCSIRSRVEQNAILQRPSSDWHKASSKTDGEFAHPTVVDLGVPAIRPEEWLLDPGAAR